MCLPLPKDNVVVDTSLYELARKMLRDVNIETGSPEYLAWLELATQERLKQLRAHEEMK